MADKPPIISEAELTLNSEAELIGVYLAPLAAGLAGSFQLQDDCARIEPVPGFDFVVTTDAVAEGTHYFPDDAPAGIAWKALAVNASDLAAKGARPHSYQMALSFPEAPSHAYMSAFASGLAAAQETFGMLLSGGDTDRRPGPCSITITALGLVPAGRMVTRMGARAGDRLFVSGTLGDSALGLKLRRGDADAAGWPLTEPARAALVERYLRPAPRLDLIEALLTWSSAAMDISDGLGKDLGRLCAASETGATVWFDRLPLSPAARVVVDADAAQVEQVLAGGGDYEILFAVPPDRTGEVLAWAQRSGVAVTEIGEFKADRGVGIVGRDGVENLLAPGGWDHFAAKP